MKNIKFRGKEITTGKWVYGHYHLDQIGEPSISTSDEIWHVEPSSVGQWTGKDEIYSGDRIKCLDYQNSDWYQGIVIFEDSCFCVEIEKCLTEDVLAREFPMPKWSIGQSPAMYEFQSFSVIGSAEK